MIDFLINNKSALSMGLRMGSSFINNIEAPADQKECITNSSRLEHGDHIYFVNKLASRSVTLEFIIIGKATDTQTAHENFESRKDAFLEILQNGYLTISIPYSRKDVYRLYAQMKSTTYSKGVGNGGAIAKMSVKFLEPDPTDRGAFGDADTAKLSE